MDRRSSAIYLLILTLSREYAESFESNMTRLSRTSRPIARCFDSPPRHHKSIKSLSKTPLLFISKHTGACNEASVVEWGLGGVGTRRSSRHPLLRTGDMLGCSQTCRYVYRQRDRSAVFGRLDAIQVDQPLQNFQEISKPRGHLDT